MKDQPKQSFSLRVLRGILNQMEVDKAKNKANMKESFLATADAAFGR